jgi:hypothetical protein
VSVKRSVNGCRIAITIRVIEAYSCHRSQASVVARLLPRRPFPELTRDSPPSCIANTLVTVVTPLIPSRLLVEPGSVLSVLRAAPPGRVPEMPGTARDVRYVPYWSVTDSGDDLVIWAGTLGRFLARTPDVVRAAGRSERRWPARLLESLAAWPPRSCENRCKVIM